MTTIPYPTRPKRPERISPRESLPAKKTDVHIWAQASGRMLISTFFIATSVSNMGESSFGFGDMAIAESSLIFNVMIYSMAFAVLVGRYVHIAALLLALALLWTSSIELTSGAQDLASYWQDLAIIGALFFMAAQKGSAVNSAFARAITRGRVVVPRRVVPDGRVNFDHAVAGAQVHASRNHVARPVAMPMFVSRRED
jgi:hypothetical protein